MERTEAREILGAGFLEFDIVSDDADDVRLLLERLCEIVGGHQPILSASIVGQASLKRNIAGLAWAWKNCELHQLSFERVGKRGLFILTGPSVQVSQTVL
jgi:hypothetical protein